MSMLSPICGSTARTADACAGIRAAGPPTTMAPDEGNSRESIVLLLAVGEPARGALTSRDGIPLGEGKADALKFSKC